MNHAAQKDILTHLRSELHADGGLPTGNTQSADTAPHGGNVVPMTSRLGTSVVAQPAGAVLTRKWLELRRDIDCALARLDEGSYGYCQICGDRITDSHLSEHPATPFCASCSG
ncbi:TraR/DksA family transcriptional regulator [Phaeobacter sp. C3_T13_0]|uniref:TraR/DksA family transcriptional regulator n=1 Tax=Phaeobacter cretensis TaxID=3342641 RepID=UPI0039BCF3AC